MEFRMLDLSSAFKKSLDKLFKINNFKCKNLVYGREIYYCGKDISNCLNYNIKILEKLKKRDKFTFYELEKKYSNFYPSSEFEKINKETIDSLCYDDKKNFYINKNGLMKLVGNCDKKESESFKKFILKILIPKLDRVYYNEMKSCRRSHFSKRHLTYPKKDSVYKTSRRLKNNYVVKN